MRVTLALLGYHGQRGAHPGRIRKIRWRESSPIVVPKEVTIVDPRLQTVVEQSGKQVENPFWNPPWEKPQEHPQWIPERDDPRFEKYSVKPTIEAHPLWKSNAAYVYDQDTKLQCRMDQAKILTKTIVVEGLPSEVEDLIGAYKMTNQDEIVRRLVLQAVAWDQKKDPLPQWFEEVSPLDPYKFISREDQLRKTKAEVPKGPSYQKQADNLMGDLLRICDISNHEHSAAKEDAPKISKSHVNRQLVRDCDFQTVYEHFDGDLVHLSGKLHSVLYREAPLPPPASQTIVDETMHEKLPELWPLKPTIDMLPKHIYDNEDMLTFRKGKIPKLSHPIYPHTLNYVGPMV